MKRSEFLGMFLGYIIKKAPKWLPEEGIEEDMFDILQKRLMEHSTVIKKALKEMSKVCLIFLITSLMGCTFAREISVTAGAKGAKASLYGDLEAGQIILNTKTYIKIGGK